MNKLPLHLSTKEIIDLFLSNKNAFVCYKLPGKQDIVFSILEEKTNNNNEKLNGFFFQPFNPNKEISSYLYNRILTFTNNSIPIDLESTSKANSYKFKSLPSAEKNFKNINRIDYSNLISKAVKEISTTKLDKVVLSRQIYKKEIIINKAGTYFNELIKKYTSAYVYLIHIPGKMAWMGASPEIFLIGNDTNYKTVALAGTIQNSGIKNIEWRHKEIEEQKIVGDYIEDVIKDLDIHDFDKSGPKTISAGNLFHLQTEYEFQLQDADKQKSKLINALHPTPAVCGTPKNKAIKLINTLEDYDRQYYSGIVGNINNQQETNLYVNLRCLQFFEEGSIIYSGGGITIDSDPEMEWEETCFKAETLLSVLEKI